MTYSALLGDRSVRGQERSRSESADFSPLPVYVTNSSFRTAYTTILMGSTLPLSLFRKEFIDGLLITLQSSCVSSYQGPMFAGSSTAVSGSYPGGVQENSDHHTVTG